MAEEEAGSGVLQCEGVIVERRLNPEKDSGSGGALLREMAEATIRQNLQDICRCILTNIQAKHLPSAKLLFELAARLKSDPDAPAEVYRGFAEQLQQSLEMMEREERAADGEQRTADRGQRTENS